MKAFSQWIGDLARSGWVGKTILRSVRVGAVGSIQLANLHGGGAFYRAARRAIEWIFHYSPERYYRLAGRVDWLAYRRNVHGPGCFVPFPHWRCLTVDFNDLGDEDASAAFLARSLIEWAFLIRHRYNTKGLSDEQLVRMGRIAYRGSAYFIKKLGRDLPELAEQIEAVYPAFDPEAFLIAEKMPYSRRTSYVPRRRSAV